MVKFRDHIDAHNKHMVRLAEREIVCGGRRFQMFALQPTGGGHFPVKDAHPETAVNILKANVVPLLGLDVEDGVEWDIVSATPPPQTKLDLFQEQHCPRPKDPNIFRKIRRVF